MYKAVGVTLVLAIAMVVFAVAGHKSTSAAEPNHSPILVELFTSEGCSSCPPADKLLAQLEREGTFNGHPIVVMGEHVDYWNGLGWSDRFSSSVFSERQSDFVRRLHLSSAYTPQMVINGRQELVGNDEAALQKALVRENAASPATVSINLNGDTADIQVQNAPVGATAYLAITETALTTQVGRGENKGRQLQHAGVVRRLQKLGSIERSNFETRVRLATDRSWNPANVRVIAFVQSDRGIEGASSVRLP